MPAHGHELSVARLELLWPRANSLTKHCQAARPSGSGRSSSLLRRFSEFVDVRRSSPQKVSRATVDHFSEMKFQQQCRSHAFACFALAFAHVDLHRVVLLLVAFAQNAHKELTSEC